MALDNMTEEEIWSQMPINWDANKIQDELKKNSGKIQELESPENINGKEVEEESDHIRIGLKSVCWVVRFLGILPLPIHMIKQLSFSPLSWEANVYSGDNKTHRLQTLRLCMWRYKETHHTKMDILSKRSI